MYGPEPGMSALSKFLNLVFQNSPTFLRSSMLLWRFSVLMSAMPVPFSTMCAGSIASS